MVKKVGRVLPRRRRRRAGPAHGNSYSGLLATGELPTLSLLFAINTTQRTCKYGLPRRVRRRCHLRGNAVAKSVVVKWCHSRGRAVTVRVERKSMPRVGLVVTLSP